MSRFSIVLIVALLISKSFTDVSFCQSVWRDEIPDAFQHPNPSLAIVHSTWVALGLTDEQQKQARTIFKDYEEINLRAKSPKESKAAKFNLISRFESTLTPDQQELFDLLSVKDYFKRLSDIESTVSKPHDHQLSRILLSKSALRLLKIDENQATKIASSYENSNSEIDDAKVRFGNDLAILFKRWQADLESQLLQPQLTIYQGSLGDTFPVPKLLQKFTTISIGSLPQFLQTSQKIRNSFVTNSPQPELMLMTKPWFIDCKPDPAGFFALLLSSKWSKNSN